MGRETHSRAIGAMRVYDRQNAAFPELKAMHQIVVRADAKRSAEVTEALRELARDVRDDPRLSGDAALSTSRDKRISVLQLQVPHHVSTDAAQDSLRSIRAEHVPATIGRLAGVENAVTGDVARYADYPEHQKDKLPLIVGALLIVTFAMTVWAFRSVVLGLVGVVLNLLSAGASLGVLVLTFQPSWAEGLLDFDSTGSVGSQVPLFLFVILFGLLMDYQVFVVSRIREAALAGVPTRRAVIEGIGRSAGVVTSAAVVMVTVFASFVGLHLIEMKQIGYVLAVAVLLDAFVIRMLVLPALMLLLAADYGALLLAARRQVPGPRAGLVPSVLLALLGLHVGAVSYVLEGAAALFVLALPQFWVFAAGPWAATKLSGLVAASTALGGVLSQGWSPHLRTGNLVAYAAGVVVGRWLYRFVGLTRARADALAAELA